MKAMAQILILAFVVVTFAATSAAAQACGTPQYRSCWGYTTTQSATICGDYLYGSSGNDVLAGWDGDDTIDGGSAGDDRLCGENDDDVIWASYFCSSRYGIVRMTGGSGNDFMCGTDSPDYMNGELGNDEVYGLGGSDYQLQGGPGNDIVDGGAGTDWVEGNTGSWDRCYSGIGYIGCEQCDGGSC